MCYCSLEVADVKVEVLMRRSCFVMKGGGESVERKIDLRMS